MSNRKQLDIFSMAVAAVLVILFFGVQRWLTTEDFNKPAPVATVQPTTVNTAVEVKKKDKVVAHNAAEVMVYKPRGVVGAPEGSESFPVSLGSDPGDLIFKISLSQDLEDSHEDQSNASASVVIPTPPPSPQKAISNPSGSFGLVGVTSPGYVALDFRLWSLGSFGLDVQANQFQAGVGVSYGDRIFGAAGLSMDWRAQQQPWVGIGIRL